MPFLFSQREAKVQGHWEAWGAFGDVKSFLLRGKANAAGAFIFHHLPLAGDPPPSAEEGKRKVLRCGREGWAYRVRLREGAACEHILLPPSGWLSSLCGGRLLVWGVDSKAFQESTCQKELAALRLSSMGAAKRLLPQRDLSAFG